MRNPRAGFVVWMPVGFWEDVLPKRWANKCLDSQSSANLDRGVESPTSWGRGVYLTCAQFADCGLKPNGQTIHYLLPKAKSNQILGFTRGEKGNVIHIVIPHQTLSQCFHSIWSGLKLRPLPKNLSLTFIMKLMWIFIPSWKTCHYHEDSKQPCITALIHDKHQQIFSLVGEEHSDDKFEATTPCCIDS